MSRLPFRFWMIIVPDALLLYAGLFLSIRLRYPGGLSEQAVSSHITAFTILHIFWLAVFFIHGLFETGVFRRYTTLVFNLLSAMSVNVVLSVVYFYFQPNFILTPRRFLLIDTAIVLLLLLAWNLIVKFLLKSSSGESLYLFLFQNEAFNELKEQIKNHEFLGYKLLGVISEAEIGSMKLEPGAVIIVPSGAHLTPQASTALYNLRTKGVRFYNHKDFYESLLRRVHLSDLNELWFLENVNYGQQRLYSLLKRLMDLLLGVIAFAFFVITYPFFALLIKISSSGPVLFKQLRVGEGGSVFTIYKYRTMFGGRTDTWTEKNDPRITTLGNILRKTRIDELPQSLNLMRGDLSLVGPRPEQVGIVEQLRKQIPFYDERHLVKPGITGWAQLNIYAGSLEETKVKLQYDLYYIKHRSFLFDMEIILKTIYYIFTWQGR